MTPCTTLNSNTPLNTLLGNPPLSSAPNSLECPISRHLNTVLERHLSSNVSQQVRKELRLYIEEGQFPVIPIGNDSTLGQQGNHLMNHQKLKLKLLQGLHQRGQKHAADRIPCFIDESNRYCAVGHLMKSCGFDDLARDINKNYQFWYLGDIVKDLEQNHSPNAKQIKDGIGAFCDKTGLNLTEMMQIQPTYEFNNPFMRGRQGMRHFAEEFHGLQHRADASNQAKHEGFRCKNCGIYPIRGVMYLCSNCPAKDRFAFCSQCVEHFSSEKPSPNDNPKKKHFHDHTFLKVGKPLDAKEFDSEEKPLVESEKLMQKVKEHEGDGKQ